MHDVGVIDDLPWRTSTRCASSGCVEVATTPTGAYVRDSKPGGDGGVLRFDRAAWAGFVGAVKRA